MVKWNREETLLNDGGLKKVPKDLPSEPGNDPTGIVLGRSENFTTLSILSAAM